MQIQPCLFFDGRCEEALEFYGKALGAKIEMMMRFKDSPDQTMIRPGSENKIMHASFRVGDSRCWRWTECARDKRRSRASRCHCRSLIRLRANGASPPSQMADR